jgi:hypoxanthine-guanine phosphoribosyltransferase
VLWREEVERIFRETQIARRITTLAREIEHSFCERKALVVSLLNGTLMFVVVRGTENMMLVSVFI